MRAVGAFVLAVWSVCLFGQPALADKRVALVIGNSGYQNVARLGNPTNDASAITEILKGAGFDLVESRLDLKISEMRRVFRDFANSSRDADVAVVYYAGHGIEVEGTNYLIPIDASLEQDLDVYDEAFSLDRILVTIEPAKQLRLVILDACRNNPFARAMKRTIGSRAIGMGLAKVEPTSPNTLIAFASKAGSTASDGDSKNSPFTAALVRHIAKPGLDLRKAFGFVRDDVLKNTSNKQEPYVYGSLGGDDVPLVPAKLVVSEPLHNAQADVRRDYELALQVGTKKVWDAFIANYPSGFYTELAEAQRLVLEGAKQTEQAKAAPEAKAAEEARVAAEKAKQVEQAKVLAAEQVRVAAENVAADKAAADKAVEKVADAEQRKPALQVASLPSPDTPGPKPALSRAEMTRSLQVELRRVGCLTGAVDGEWTSASRRSLELFNKHAGMKLEVKLASLDALDAIKTKPDRICPLSERPAAKPEAKRESRPEAKSQLTASEPAEQPQSGEIICGTGGCRPVKKGCRLGAIRNSTNPSVSVTGEVCN
ncbi:MAG TPA: caspase family protein [Bradyrhizobium sp.]|nr:caspase family protein [Bradyrhizobium sp.]